MTRGLSKRQRRQPLILGINANRNRLFEGPERRRPIADKEEEPRMGNCNSIIIALVLLQSSSAPPPPALRPPFPIDSRYWRPRAQRGGRPKKKKMYKKTGCWPGREKTRPDQARPGRRATATAIPLATDSRLCYIVHLLLDHAAAVLLLLLNISPLFESNPLLDRVETQ